MKKYYQAYEERYKSVHRLGYLWFSTEPTPELLNWVKTKKIPFDEPILEVGCGEGRDILHLATQGYQMAGVDISSQAISKCSEIVQRRNLVVDLKVSDALSVTKQIHKRYKWIYSVATLHMLVNSEDRICFLNELYKMLTPGGSALLVNKGDGITERVTDPQIAFTQEELILQYNEEIKVKVASTSYRAVNWDTHLSELEEAGFIIEKKLNTENYEYQDCMTVYLKKEC